MKTEGKALISLKRLEELEEKEASLKYIIGKKGYTTIYSLDGNVHLGVFHGKWEKMAKCLADADEIVKKNIKNTNKVEVDSLNIQMNDLKKIIDADCLLYNELKQKLIDERKKSWIDKLFGK